MDQPADDGPTQPSPTRILVVDDEQPVRDAVARTLRRLGYEVDCAESGEEALALVENGSRFALVVTDIVMHGMSGVDLAKQVKRIDDDVRLLLISGYPGRHLDNSGIGLTKSDLLQKPFTPIQLTTRVQQKLERADVRQPEPAASVIV